MKEQLLSFQHKIVNSELFELNDGAEYTTDEIKLLGDMLSASLMLRRIKNFQLAGVDYMNIWGLKKINKTLEEIKNMGDTYYDLFFDQNERKNIFQNLETFLFEADFTKQYNFFNVLKFTLLKNTCGFSLSAKSSTSKLHSEPVRKFLCWQVLCTEWII